MYRMQAVLCNEPAVKSSATFRGFVEKEYAKWREVEGGFSMVEVAAAVPQGARCLVASPVSRIVRTDVRYYSDADVMREIEVDP